MKKIALVVIVGISLAGCKSSDSVRSKQPVDKGVSIKSVNQFSSCVSRSWANNGPAVTSLPIENGISILVLQAWGGYDVILDITKKEAGSSYVLYERISALTSASYENAVMACK